METTTERSVSHVPAGAGEQYNVIGELITFKVTQSETNGAFSVMEMVAQPGGGPPLHTHPSSEVFTVLEGEFEFTCLEGGLPKTFRATVGDTIFIPDSGPHTYRAVGDTPAKTLLVLTPGFDLEGFFAEAGTPVTDGQPAPAGPPDMMAVIAIAEKHGMVFLPPSTS